MPYVHISASAEMTQEKKMNLREEIAEILPILPGKNRDNSMVHIEDSQFIVMGDPSVPAVFAEIRLYKQSPAAAKAQFAAALTALFEKHLGVPADHVYMNYMEMDHWVLGGEII